MYRDSIYNKILEEGAEYKSNGYDYRERGIVDKFFAKRMFMSPLMAGFIKKIEPYFVEILDSVKKLQFYQNYTIDKNDGRINT